MEREEAHMKRTTTLLLVVALFALACSHSRQYHRRSSVMGYLYPEAQSAPAPNPAGARLQLPLKIGIAFVPPDAVSKTPYQGEWRAIVPSGTERQLLDIVKRAFQGRDWVGRIEIIPSSYLTPRGGFANLQQVSRMLGVDVIALVSVDQVQNSDPTPISFLYLSIIGAYVLPLDHNETRTMIDVAAFHVPTQTFLLRAPGVSRVTGRSSAVDVSESLREASEKGFQQAMTEVSKNLDVEVERFKDEVRTGERADVDIVTAQGQSVRHGGSFGWPGALAGIFILLGILWWRR